MGRRGTFSQERTDYPPFAAEVARLLQKKSVDCGVLLCGSGAGMAIAANRFEKIYAALVWDEVTAYREKRKIMQTS